MFVGLALTLVIAFGVSRYASERPDGLESVAQTHGLHVREQRHALADAPFADYETAGVANAGTAKGLAGVVGVVVTFVIASGLCVLAMRRHRATRPTPDAPPSTA